MRRTGFFAMPALYLGVTYLVGENHPFSKFQMYSQFPSVADYFYLANSANQPISCYREFNYRTNELKDMIQLKVANYHLDRNSDEQLMAPAKEVLNYVLKNNKGNPNLMKFINLKLIRHEIRRIGDSIMERDVVLAVAKMSDLN